MRCAVAVPLLWSLFGIPAVLKLGMLEDIALPIAALVLAGYMISDRLVHVRPLPV